MRDETWRAMRGGLAAMTVLGALAFPAGAARAGDAVPSEAPSAAGPADGAEARPRFGQVLRQEFRGFKDDVRKAASERIHKVEGEVKARAEAKVEERVQEKVFGAFGGAAFIGKLALAGIVALVLLMVLAVFAMVRQVTPRATAGGPRTRPE